MKSLKEQGHGFFRKSKAYGLVSLLTLGSLVVVSGVAADETVPVKPTVGITANPATNLTTAQAAPNEESLAIAKDSGSQTGELKAPVTSESLEKAISDATKTGVVVTEDKLKTHLSLADAQTDLAKQEKTIKDVTDTHKALADKQVAAKEEAQKAGVVLISGTETLYTDISKAKADALTQEEALKKASQAQTEAGKALSEAMKKANSAGVTITLTEKENHQDITKALEALIAQLNHLDQVTRTQQEADQLLAEAIKQAKQAGLVLVIKDKVTIQEVSKALDHVTNQVTQLAQLAQTKADMTKALEDAKTKAKTAGVAVSEGTVKQYQTAQDAQADIDKQLATLTIALTAQTSANQTLDQAVSTARQAGTVVVNKGLLALSADEAGVKLKDIKQSIEAVVRENDAIKKANEAGKAKVTSDKEEIDRYNNEVRAENRRIMEAAGLTFNDVYALDLATVEEYNRTGRKKVSSRTEVVGDPTAFNQANDNATNQLPAGDNGYTPSGSSTFMKAQKLGDIDIVAGGSLEPNKNTVYIQGDISESRIIDKVIWGNVAPEGGFLRQGTYGNPGFYWTGAYNYNPDGTTTQLWTIKTKEWYKLPKAITMMDGSVHDAYVQFDVDPKGLYLENAETFTDGNYAVIWNQNGAINALNGFTQGIDNGGSGIRTTIKVDSPDNDKKYLWLSLMSDFDGGQLLDKLDSSGKILGIGGGFATNSLANGQLASDENLGFTWGHNRDKNALNGFASSPDGTALIAQYGNSYSTVLRNTPGGNSSAVARADFGSDAGVSKSVIKTRLVVEEKPEIHIKPLKEHDRNDFMPSPLKEAETYSLQVKAEAHSVVLETEVTGLRLETAVTPLEMNANVHEVKLKTTSHPVEVNQKPVNVKAVKNTDQISIDGHLVAKGSTVIWTLHNSPLKAGRSTVMSYVLSDPLPAGFEIDDKASQDKSPDWVIGKDASGKTLISASQALLENVNRHLRQDVELPVVSIVGRPLNDGGTYQNTFKTLITTADGVYTVTSNTPVIYTPGNDPKIPRNPGGEDPTPNDNLIKPKKDVVDEAGNSVNGKSVLPNSVLNYVAEQDFDQYKGMVASRETIMKGFIYVDDYKDEALDGKSMVVNSIKAKNGDDVSKLLDMYHVLSKETLDTKLQSLLTSSGISPVGEFYMWVAKDPESFFKAYIQKGLDITYNLSFKIKESFTSGDITNQTYQIDFGNGYYSNIVVNHLPKLAVHKEVLDQENGKSIHNGTVKLGDEVTYKLAGWVVPTGRSYDLFEYKFVDQLQHSHDLYLRDKVVSKVDITLTDGTVIQKGTDLGVYTETTYNQATGRYELAFKKDFLEKVARESEFGADAFLVVKRIQSGDVSNEYTLYVNGNPVTSNKVVTHTPEPPAPVKPRTPRLPETGEATQTSLFTSLLGVITLGLVGLGAKKKQDS